MYTQELLSFITKLLGRPHIHRNNEYAFNCPFCNHHKKKLQLNLETYKWHCWVCNERGRTFFQLLKRLKSPKRLFSELNDILGDSVSYTFKETDKKDDKKLFLPKEFLPLYIKSDSPNYKHAMKYIKNRGITNKDIIKYNIGYCEDGEYRNRIIIPSYDSNGNLNYFVGRDFYDSKLKYKNPKVSKDVIGFDLFINWNLPIVLCEGVFDAMAIKRNAIPLFGKTIPKELAKKIIEKRVKNIYISLDNDAQKDGVKISKHFMDNGISVNNIKLPQGEDPSSIGFSKFVTYINNSVNTTFKDIMKQKLGIST